MIKEATTKKRRRSQRPAFHGPGPPQVHPRSTNGDSNTVRAITTKPSRAERANGEPMSTLGNPPFHSAPNRRLETLRMGTVIPPPGRWNDSNAMLSGRPAENLPWASLLPDPRARHDNHQLSERHGLLHLARPRR
jgi:hypothetical protein